RLRQRIQILDRWAKSPVQECAALSSREGAGDRRNDSQAFFALRLLMLYRSKEGGEGGLAFPQCHGVNLLMLLKDVLGMEGGMLAAPYTVDVRTRGPDASRNCNAVCVVGEGMERESHQAGSQLDHASHEAVVVQVERVSIEDADRVTRGSQVSGEVTDAVRILDRRSGRDRTIVARPNKHDIRSRLV